MLTYRGGRRKTVDRLRIWPRWLRRGARLEPGAHIVDRSPRVLEIEVYVPLGEGTGATLVVTAVLWVTNPSALVSAALLDVPKTLVSHMHALLSAGETREIDDPLALRSHAERTLASRNDVPHVGLAWRARHVRVRRPLRVTPDRAGQDPCAESVRRIQSYFSC